MERMSEDTPTPAPATATAEPEPTLVPIDGGEMPQLPDDIPQFVRDVVELTNIYVGLEPHAQRVLLRIARRLQAGQAQYGKLDLLTDPRNLIEEAVQEAADKAVYEAAEAERLLMLRESS